MVKRFRYDVTVSVCQDQLSKIKFKYIQNMCLYSGRRTLTPRTLWLGLGLGLGLGL